LNESADVKITINQYDIRKQFPTVYYNINEMLPLTLGSLKIMTLITNGGGVTDIAKIVFTLQCILNVYDSGFMACLSVSPDPDPPFCLV
jgi:hypothetical protein